LELTTSPGFDIFAPSGPSQYRYGASLIINDDDSIDFWACSQGSGPFPGVADVIRYRHSTDGGATWTPDIAALIPTADSPDQFATCDPGVVKLDDGYYYMGYTATDNGATGGVENHVFVARSTSPSGGFQKWNGSGWGGSPQPFISFTGTDGAFGAGEPSFVSKDSTLYIYYTWADAGVPMETRVATASASDPDWPANLTYHGKAINSKDPGEDQTDVKYVDAYDKFIAVSVAERFGPDSYLHAWESSDGLNFSPLQNDNITENIVGYAHNAGISGTSNGHFDVNDNNFVSIAHGPTWGKWSNQLVPIDVTAVAPPVDETLLHYNFGSGSGSIVTDLSGKGNDGILVGFFDTSAGAGSFDLSEGWVNGGGLSFLRGGTDNYIETPLALSELSGRNFTIEYTANYTGIGDNGWVAGISSDGASGVELFQGIQFFQANLETNLNGTGGATGTNPWGAAGSEDFHHIAVVYDNSAGEIEVFVDGVSEGIFPKSGISNLPDLVRIGSSGWSGGGEQWGGIFTGVAISTGMLAPGSFVLTAIPGDFNGDGAVDTADLTDPTGWYTRFGADLDGIDFLDWQRNFDRGVVPFAAVQTVPEPSTVMLLTGVAVIGLGTVGRLFWE